MASQSFLNHFHIDVPVAQVNQLLEYFGEQNFDSEGIIAVEDGTRDGYLEFFDAAGGFSKNSGAVSKLKAVMSLRRP